MQFARTLVSLINGCSKKKQQDGFELCLLLIDPQVLLDKQCLYYPHNAATKSYRYADPSLFNGADALERLFEKEIRFHKANEDSERCIYRFVKNQAETTSDQAEVQCLENIEARYIKHIITDNITLNFSEVNNYVNDDGVFTGSYRIKNKRFTKTAAELYSESQPKKGLHAQKNDSNTAERVKIKMSPEDRELLALMLNQEDSSKEKINSEFDLSKAQDGLKRSYSILPEPDIPKEDKKKSSKENEKGIAEGIEYYLTKGKSLTTPDKDKLNNHK